MQYAPTRYCTLRERGEKDSINARLRPVAVEQCREGDLLVVASTAELNGK